MGEEVKVLGIWASPFCCRVEIALKLKGVEYEYIQQDLENKSNILLNSNPIYEKVPVLVHNGKAIPESLVILEYIDDTWPQNPIFPKEPYARALARFWVKFVEEKLMQTVYKTSEAKREEIEKLKEEWNGNLRLIENELKDKEFFGGERIGYLDIVFIVLSHWFQVVREQVFNIDFITQDEFPVLHKWMQKLRQIDFVSECLPPTDKLAAFIKSRIQPGNSASK